MAPSFSRIAGIKVRRPPSAIQAMQGRDMGDGGGRHWLRFIIKVEGGSLDSDQRPNGNLGSGRFRRMSGGGWMELSALLCVSPSVCQDARQAAACPSGQQERRRVINLSDGRLMASLIAGWSRVSDCDEF